MKTKKRRKKNRLSLSNNTNGTRFTEAVWLHFKRCMDLTFKS